MTFTLPTWLVLWFLMVFNTPVGRDFSPSELNLQGPVKSFFYNPSSPLNSKSGKISDTDTILFKFDREGHLLSYTKAGVTITVRSTYYPSGKAMQTLHFDNSGNILQQDFYYYDKQGRLSRKILINSQTGSSLYRYAYQQGFLHHVSVVRDYDFRLSDLNDLSTQLSQWDEALPREVYHFDTEKRLMKVESWSNGKLRATDHVEYDARSRLISILGSMDLKLEYNYDPYPIAMSQGSNERSIENVLDSYGNPVMIKDTMVNGDNTATTEYHFSIEYWK